VEREGCGYPVMGFPRVQQGQRGSQLDHPLWQPAAFSAECQSTPDGVTIMTTWGSYPPGTRKHAPDLG
jgi:hypothetical protein